MTEAYIVDAVRTPIGKKNGGLSGVHPADLGAHVIKAVVERTGIDPAGVETSSSVVSTRSADRQATSPAPRGSPPATRKRSRGSRSTGSAGRASRPSTSVRRRSSAAPPT